MICSYSLKRDNKMDISEIDKLVMEEDIIIPSAQGLIGINQNAMLLR